MDGSWSDPASSLVGTVLAALFLFGTSAGRRFVVWAMRRLPEKVSPLEVGAAGAAGVVLAGVGFQLLHPASHGWAPRLADMVVSATGLGAIMYAALRLARSGPDEEHP